jgi:hypothetical protein
MALRGRSANQETAMKMILKSTIAAAAFAAAMVPGLAFAQVGVSVGIGGVGVGVGVGVGAPVFDQAGYGPCGPGYAPCGAEYNPYDGDNYYDPIYYGGSWYHGPYRWQMRDGQREFYVNGGWHRNEWTGGAYPASMTFSNGGYYRGGRYDGWDGSDRINSRYHAANRPMRDERHDDAHDGGDHPNH